MTTLRPDISPGSRVCHWPTRERGVIVSALPAGYFDWLYIFQPDDAPTVRRQCTLESLATFDNIILLSAARQLREAHRFSPQHPTTLVQPEDQPA
jgi:hypothetical protein